MRETAQDSVHFIIDANQKKKKKGEGGGVHLKSVFKGGSSHIVWRNVSAPASLPGHEPKETVRP